MKTAVIRVLLWGALLATPGEAWSQDGGETSVWQLGLRDMDWEAVEQFMEKIRDYRAAGAIGDFELHIRPNEARLDAMVTAEIVDIVKLADLRGLNRPEAARGLDHPTRVRLEPGSRGRQVD